MTKAARGLKTHAYLHRIATRWKGPNRRSIEDDQNAYAKGVSGSSEPDWAMACHRNPGLTEVGPCGGGERGGSEAVVGTPARRMGRPSQGSIGFRDGVPGATLGAPPQAIT